MGLRGLHFLDKTSGGKEGWKAVERRFEEMNKGGRLPNENFGKCIGLGDSKEFAGELFVVLARRRHLEPDNDITKEQLKEFWEMSDQNFNSQLCIFFDMSDKNGDGMLMEDEVKDVIILSASANKLAKLKGRALTYTSLIMEELDPDDRGYIEIWQLETLLRGMVSTQVLEKLTMIPSRYWSPLKRHISKTVDLGVDIEPTRLVKLVKITSQFNSTRYLNELKAQLGSTRNMSNRAYIGYLKHLNMGLLQTIMDRSDEGSRMSLEGGE